MEHTSIKLYHNPNPNDFLAKDIENRPNRFTCYLNFKLMLGESVELSSKCSGILLAKDCLLTAAHGAIPYINAKKRMDNLHLKTIDLSQVKLALHEGTSRGRYAIKRIRMSQKYDGKFSNMHDFALVELEAVEQTEGNESNFPAVLAVSPGTMASIKAVSVLGYPIRSNQKNSPFAQSSIYMSNQYESSGPILKSQGSKILYTLPTEQGFSGGPLFTDYKGQQVVIALHKATTFSQTNEKEMFQHNLGVNAHQMLEEVNQWGFELHQRPFVFTEKTLSMRDFFKNIKTRQVLSFSTFWSNQVDKGLEATDLKVILSYKWSKLKIINLSGNNFGDEGFLRLTKQKFEQLQSLSLQQDGIKTIEEVPEENWRNLITLTRLNLNLNSISSFPEGMSLLDNLQELGLAYNHFRQIPESFLAFCRTRTRPLAVTLYKNKIREEKHLNQDKLREIAKTLVTCQLGGNQS